MNDLEWKEVLGRRVALVPAGDGDCSVSGVECPFFRPDESKLGGSSCRTNLACMKGMAGATWMFITEDQLPAYLAARLTNQS